MVFEVNLWSVLRKLKYRPGKWLDGCQIVSQCWSQKLKICS